MIKMLTAFTEEIDDADTAIAEIFGQLDTDRLMKHSVGIIHCFTDFAESGVLATICERLPFDVVGITTMSASVNGVMSDLVLTLSVLTSDDVEFATGVSIPVSDNLTESLADLYQRLTAAHAEKPALLLTFLPFIAQLSGDAFAACIDKLSKGVPAFGCLAITNEPDFDKSYTIYNGKAYPVSMALIALYGEVNPLFFTASVDEEQMVISKQRGVITGINKTSLQSVNGLSAVQYLESIGIIEKDDTSSMVYQPLVAHLPDGSRLIRACLSAGNNGAINLSGIIPANASIVFTNMDAEKLIKLTGAKVQQALDAAYGRLLLMYSCSARNWALGTAWLEEHKKVDKIISGSVPYHFVYSGGEIFPSKLEDGTFANYMQNYSMIICVL
jgi:hypothetical protein